MAHKDLGSAAAVTAWFDLRAEDRSAAAVALHALRHRAGRIVAARCRCGVAVAEDHVADAVFVMVYGIRRTPRLRISATTTLAYLCGVARKEWRGASGAAHGKSTRKLAGAHAPSTRAAALDCIREEAAD